MKKDRQTILEEVECELEHIVKEFGIQFANQIRPTVRINIEKGRLDHFLDNYSSKTIGDYVRRVVTGHIKYHDYIFQIQQARSAIVWEPLQERLEIWTYHYLLRKGFFPGERTQNLAREYAIEVAIAVLQAGFSYDTDIDAWIQQIVIYTCCNQIELWKRQQDIENRLIQIISDEQPLSSKQEDVEHHITSQEGVNAIHQAIQQLENPKMREVVILRYYRGLSSQEIAQVINSTFGYVDKLHCQAKQMLGKSLQEQGYTLEG